MPIKWSAAHDQYLLLKILEVSNVSINYGDIAASWDFNGEKPTAKAITEHIGKLRKMAGVSGGNSKPIPNANVKNGSAALTPRKPRVPKAAATPTNSTKRKRQIKREASEDADEDEDDSGLVPYSSNNFEDNQDSPAKKKVKTGSEHAQDDFEDLDNGANVYGYDGTANYPTPAMTEMW